VRVPDPPYDYATEGLEYRSYADLVNFKWIEDSYVRPFSSEEILQRTGGGGPSSCTPRQLRIALIQAGIFPSTIQNFIDTIQDPIQKEIAIAEWEYALEIRKEHPLVIAIAANLNLTEAQINAIFSVAATL
jgi:hypothetical protein